MGLLPRDQLWTAQCALPSTPDMSGGKRPAGRYSILGGDGSAGEVTDAAGNAAQLPRDQGVAAHHTLTGTSDAPGGDQSLGR